MNNEMNYSDLLYQIGIKMYTYHSFPS